MNHTSRTHPLSLATAAPRAGWLKLLAASFAVAAVWLVALPWLATTTPVQRHIELQESQGIDPSAVFYSELEILPPIAHHYERLHETHRDQLWGR